MKKPMILACRFTILSFSFILLSACQQLNIKQSAPINPLLRLDTSSLQREISVVQKVSTSYQGRKQTFIAQLEITREKLVMVALTEFGGKLFSLQFDNKEIHFEPSPLMKVPLNPAFLLSDLQLIYWPEHIITQSLPKEMRLTQLAGNEFSRQLYLNDNKIIDIKYHGNNKQDVLWDGKAVFRQLQNDYQLTIETLEIVEL